jgi:hypothetical protein
LVDHIEEILVHQPVEVKRHGGTRQCQGLGGVVTTDRCGLAHYIVV